MSRQRNKIITMPTHGLYAVTDAKLTPGPKLRGAVAQAIRGGARLIQYRDKGGGDDRREREATALSDLCRAAGVAFVVNDDIALAQRMGADGVHVGNEDVPVAQARVRLGPDAIVGASCYASLERAREAVVNGANYVAFGSFFPSVTKPEAATVPVDILTRARAAKLGVPIVAIGGITVDNAVTLINAGADILAVVSAVFGADDISNAAGSFAALFDAAPTS